MSLSKEQEAIKTNIKNAFKVVKSTYDNISNLFSFFRTEIDDYSYERCPNIPFLRWRTDDEKNPWGWFFHNLFVLFQKKSDEEMENKWRNGPLYCVEFCLHSNEHDSTPCIFLHRFEYKNILNWSAGCGQGENWRVYWPFRDKSNNDIVIVDESQKIIKATPKTEKYSDKHWGYISDYRMEIDLVDLTSDNIKEKVFDNFDHLDEIANGNKVNV